MDSIQLLDNVSKSDREPVLLKLATHGQGAEFALYYAIRHFYDAPSLERGRGIFAVFMTANATLTPKVDSSGSLCVRAISKSLADWEEFERGSGSNAERVKVYKKQLFDGFWRASLPWLAESVATLRKAPAQPDSPKKAKDIPTGPMSSDEMSRGLRELVAFNFPNPI